MSDEQTNAWRELTDEEIEFAAGGAALSGPIAPPGSWGRFGPVVEGLLDIVAGHATNNQELVSEGLFDIYGLRVMK